MVFLSEIKSYGTNCSAQLTEEDVLELFRTAVSAPVQSVRKNTIDWFNVYDISDIQILNPVTMQKDSGYKAVEFVYAETNYLAFVKKPDLLRRIDAMLKTGNIDLLNRLDMWDTRNPKITDVLWTNGEMYKVTCVE